MSEAEATLRARIAVAQLPTTMVGDRELFTRGVEDAKKAIAMFPNQGLHDAAAAFAITHARAVQYLEQAPALVFAAAAGGAGVRRTNALYLQYKLVPLCERGAPLKTVMRTFDVPAPLRRLKATALFPRHGPAVLAMAKLDPALLGRVVPEKPGAQKKWLSAVAEWRARLARRQRSPDTRFAWAVENIALAGKSARDIGTVADFAIQEREHFNEAWRWARAEEEATLWHDRLTFEMMLRGTPFHADSVIDAGFHPDQTEHIGFVFTALRTPRQIGEEGRAMRHCVASYIPNVIRGSSHIISIMRGGQRVATLELSKAWSVQQLKGRFNAAPSPTTTSAAHFYAAMLREREQRAKRP